MVTSVRVVRRSRPAGAFNGVKIFGATKYAERERLGETVTQWLADHAALDVVDMVVTQSSDEGYHCVTISVFYFERNARTRSGT